MHWSFFFSYRSILPVTSCFSENYLGVRNPAADYLSMLDDTIYAGIKGFVERVPTRNSWATLFELERERGNYKAFSGRTPYLRERS